MLPPKSHLKLIVSNRHADCEGTFPAYSHIAPHMAYQPGADASFWLKLPKISDDSDFCVIVAGEFEGHVGYIADQVGFSEFEVDLFVPQLTADFMGDDLREIPQFTYERITKQSFNRETDSPYEVPLPPRYPMGPDELFTL